jgi:hypothetical protein
MVERMNDLDEIVWKGRQWAVTAYGLETVGEPYHYYLTVEQLAQLNDNGGEQFYDPLFHLMEKNWLDVDDFVTAFLVALSVHGLKPDPLRVRESLKVAMKRRESLYGDVGWEGSRVLGKAVGGAVEQPPKAIDLEE